MELLFNLKPFTMDQQLPAPPNPFTALAVASACPSFFRFEKRPLLPAHNPDCYGD